MTYIKIKYLFIGLRGNAIISEIDELCFPFSEFHQEYNIKKIIKKVHNISSNGGLIIGASMGLRRSTGQLGNVYIVETSMKKWNINHYALLPF